MEISVSLDEKVRELIKRKGNVLTVSRLDLNDCCVPTDELWTEYKAPENLNHYYVVKDHSCHFFIQKGLNFRNNQVELKTFGIKPFKTIRVEGLIRF